MYLYNSMYMESVDFLRLFVLVFDKMKGFFDMDEKKKNDIEYFTIDVAHVVKCLLRRVWVIILAGILGATAAFSYASFAIAPKYSTSIMLYVNNSAFSLGGAEFSISSSEISAARSLVKTYIVMLQNRTTLNEVIEKSGVSYSYGELYDMIEATAASNTEVLKVTVTSEDPYEAAIIANCIAEVLPRRISEIIEGASMEVVDSAYVNLGKVSPNIAKYTAVGLFAGAFLAAAVLVIFAITDNTVHNEEYILRTYEHPVLAKVPDLLDSGSKRYGYQYYRKNSSNKGAQ